MKIIKGVFTYLLIMLGIVAIAGVLLFAAMAFLHVPMFGMNVIMHNTKGEQVKEITDLKFENKGVVRTIEVNSNNYDVVIAAHKSSLKNSKVIDATIFDKGLGLTTNGVTNAEVEVRYYAEVNDEKHEFLTSQDSFVTAKKIVIDINTPQGLIAYKDSRINLDLPYDGYAYNFIINSGEGDVSIIPGNEENKEELGNLEIRNLAVTTTKGNFKVRGLKEDDNKILNFGTLELKTKTGKFDFTAHEHVSIGNGLVKIEGVRGDFKFNKFTGKFAIKGENLVFDAEDIKTYDGTTQGGTFLYNCPNGTIRINKLDVGTGVTQIVTEYAKVEIGTLIGDTSIQATYGDTYIKNTYANVVDVTTTHGNITIENVTSGEHAGTVALRSRYGDINVKKYTAKGWFTNINGRITVRQEATANESTVETKLETVKGTVVAENLVGFVTATNTGSANMTIAFKKITGSEKSQIVSYGGKLTIKVPTPSTTNGTDNYFVSLNIQEGSKVNMYSGSTIDSTFTADATVGENTIPYKFIVRLVGGNCDFVEVI